MIIQAVSFRRLEWVGSAEHPSSGPLRRASALLALALLAGTVVALLAQPGFAITIELSEFQLLPSTEQHNTLDVLLSGDGLIGSSRDTAMLQGSIHALMDVELSTGYPVPTSFSFTGGTISATDMAFGLVGGLLSASSTDVAGTPLTPLPPGVVTGGYFPAADHMLSLNQGTISALDMTLNLADNPLDATGRTDGETTEGQLLITTVGDPVDGAQTYHLRMTLPLHIADSFEIEDVPFMGTATINVTADATLVAEQLFVLGGATGDYDYSGQLDCGDLSILTHQILQGTNDLRYDADRDGAVAQADIQFWVTSLRRTLLGDANLDGIVNDSDLTQLQAHLFTEDLSWCHGDFNSDGWIDGSDFNLLHSRMGLSAASATAVVPEPSAAVMVGLLCSVLLVRRRRPCHPTAA